LDHPVHHFLLVACFNNISIWQRIDTTLSVINLLNNLPQESGY